MKINDCWRLAKISLQARKKATRNTICGMVISLVIIIPLIFATIGLNLSVKSELNAHPELLFARFSSAQSGFKLDESIDEYNVYRHGNSYNSPHRSTWKDRSVGLSQFEDETFHYINLVTDIDDWGRDFNERICVDGKERNLIKFKDITYREYSALAVASESCLSKFVSSKYNFLAKSYNKGFTGNGARQVILSERYLAMAKLKPQDVYGKKVTIKIKEHSDTPSSDTIYLKTDSSDNLVDKVEYNLFEDFEVVGIMTNELWYDKSTDSGFSSIDDDYGDYFTELENANIIVSGASYYGEDGKPAIAHEFYVDENGEKLICDFGNLAEKNAMTKDFVFCGANSYNSYFIEAERENSKYTGKMNIVQMHYYKYFIENDCKDSFDRLTSMLEKVYPIYSDEYKSYNFFRVSGGNTSRMYFEFAMIDFFISSILMVLSIFSIIILLTALINLFNTIMHSVQSRKNYLGVMRAVGAKSKEIPKLYFFEVVRMMCIAFAWIAVIGIALCIVVKAIIDSVFTSAIGGYAKIMTISLPWYLIPIVILVVMAILFVVGLIFALGCSCKIAYKPIVESLEGQ